MPVDQEIEMDFDDDMYGIDDDQGEYWFACLLIRERMKNLLRCSAIISIGLFLGWYPLLCVFYCSLFYVFRLHIQEIHIKYQTKTFIHWCLFGAWNMIFTYPIVIEKGAFVQLDSIYLFLVFSSFILCIIILVLDLSSSCKKTKADQFSAISSSLIRLSLLSVLYFYLYLLSESVLWFLIPFITVTTFTMQYYIWNVMFGFTFCIKNADITFQGSLLSTVCTVSFCFGFVNLISFFPFSYCSLSDWGPVDLENCVSGYNIISGYHAPWLIQQFFLLIHLDVLKIALFPIQLETFWISIFICLFAPFADSLLEIYIEAQEKDRNEEETFLRLLLSSYLTFHLVAATIGCIWQLTIANSSLSFYELIEVTDNLPTEQKAEILAKLEATFLQEGMYT